MPDSRLFSVHAATGHAVLRVMLGCSMVMHGVVRVQHGVGRFVESTVRHFADGGSLIPAYAVRPFAWAIPPIEMALGVMILLGLFLLPAEILTGLYMAALVVGSCSVQEWSVVGLQMIYGVVVFLLIAAQPYDQWSVDGLIRGLRS